MKQLRPVIWSKGTLLTPQQLQLQDRFIESVLSFNLDALSFRPWGFTELQIDPRSLSKGSFAISRASGILPDGLLFSMPDSDAAPDSKPIRMGKHQQTANVYLSIPQYLERGLNVSLQISGNAGARSGSATRYRSEAKLVRDETAPTSEKHVQVALKNFRLLTEEDSLEGAVTMPIARVRKGNSADALELDPQFVPPLIDIGCSPYLDTIVRRLIEIMSSKSGELGAMRGQRNLSLADFSASDIPNFWLLYTVNSYLPLFRHIIETRKGHPSHLFDTMLAMAGALTTFSSKLQPGDLPSYNHEALGECFHKLDEDLRMLLQTTVTPNFVSLQLKLVRPSIYATAVSEDKYFAGAQMYLAVAADVPEEELINDVPNLIRVSSGDRAEGLMNHSVSGLRLLHTASPSTIPVKLKYKYFVLNQAGAEWDSVTRARSLAVHVPSKFANPRLELWIVMPTNA